ncbi:hypothetical protein Tco_1057924 [Tanacetum coccineum]|uniref:Uncharacterized protein n=1 Tax=Tanacetum coccineum TaxID=301880 RepID=A0ABQ5H6R8_9ASTR
MSYSEDSTVTYTEEDDLPAKEQPLPAASSPTAQSPGYVSESDLEEDQDEDDEDPEEDPADYPTDSGSYNWDPKDRDDDEEEKESSVDDANDEEDEEEDEEEDHPAPADSVSPPLVHRVTARMSIQPQTPAPFLSKEDIERFLAIPTPPPSPLTLLSLPLPQIRSPPFPVSPPLPLAPPPLPVSPTYSLGYRAAMIRLRAEAPSTSHSPPPHIILSHTRANTPPSGTPPSGTPPLLPIPLPTLSPPLHLLSTDRRADRTEVTLPPWKRLGIALDMRYEVGESSSAPTAGPTRGFRVDYGFIAIMDREIRRDPETDVVYGITYT